MKRSKCEYVRQVKNAPFPGKQFRRVIQVEKRIDLKKLVHPCIVTEDLRRGAISSLDRYLWKTKGVMDRAVALELRKLISGTIQRTKFRLMVVEHPDTPKYKGGRPKAHMPKPSAKAFAVADDLAVLRKPGQVDSAVTEIAEKHGVKQSTVYKYAASVDQFRAAEDAANAQKQRSESLRHEIQMRREAARKALRGDDKKEDE